MKNIIETTSSSSVNNIPLIITQVLINKQFLINWLFCFIK